MAGGNTDSASLLPAGDALDHHLSGVFVVVHLDAIVVTPRAEEESESSQAHPGVSQGERLSSSWG